MTDGARSGYGCAVLAGARRAAALVGADLRVRSAVPATPTTQVRLLTAAVGDRADAVILDPIPSPAVFLAVRFTHDQQVPVVLTGPLPAGGSGFAWSFVPEGATAVGRSAADVISAHSPPAAPPLVVVSGGYRDTSIVTAFRRGVRRHRLPAPHVLTLSSQSTARAEVHAFLQAHPDVDAAFAADPQAADTLATGRASLRTRRFVVVAAGTAPAELDHLDRGSVQALVGRDPTRLGAAATEQAVAAATRSLRTAPAVPVKVLYHDAPRSC